MKVNELKKYKNSGRKISMITCYDYTSAKIINETDIDCILVGDSGSMIMHGACSTVHANVSDMTSMIRGVVKGITSSKFVVGDMPFLSNRKGIKFAMETVEAFIKAGANMIKLEGVIGNETLIKHIVHSGVPVMGHIGLTPQSINSLGGYFVQGKLPEHAEKLLQEAKILEESGCCSLVLECVPSELAKLISDEIEIPTIGIGAGVHTDGQVLVLQDMLGMFKDINPKFVRQYFNGFEVIKNAVNAYNSDVKENCFPNAEESFWIKKPVNDTAETEAELEVTDVY